MQMPSPSSFFKILLDPSAPHMSLPPDFVSMQLKNNIPHAPTIISANGGYSWTLKIKTVDGSYCFADGWNNVVQDFKLGFGDFLFFRLVDQSTFKISVYNPNGCERTLPEKIVRNCDQDNDDDDDPFFTQIITRSHGSFLRFPRAFAELVGIDGEGTMKVKNLEGKEWVTSLKLDKSYRVTKMYFLTRGWARFNRENGLSEGDECVFKFVRSEGKLLLAKVTKNKWPPRQRSVKKVAKRKREPLDNADGGDVEEKCVDMLKPRVLFF